MKRLWVYLIMGFLSLGSLGSLAAEDPVEKETVSPAKKLAGLSYYKLKPIIVTNIKSEGQALMQVRITFVAASYHEAKLLRYHQAQIKHEVLLIAHEYEQKELITHAGRERLRAEIKQSVNKILKREEGKPLVKRVLFTKFVVKGGG